MFVSSCRNAVQLEAVLVTVWCGGRLFTLYMSNEGPLMIQVMEAKQN